MTNDAKKEYLKQYCDVLNEINCMESELATWYAKLEKVTASYSGMPHGSETSDKMTGPVAKILELKNKINDTIDLHIDMKRKIENAIAKVPSAKLRVLLRYRYIDGLRWEQVERKMGYEHSQIVRLHNEAMSALNMD